MYKRQNTSYLKTQKHVGDCPPQLPTITVGSSSEIEPLQYNTLAFYTFQKKLISILKETLPFNLKKMPYFSDGSTETGRTFITYVYVNLILE